MIDIQFLYNYPRTHFGISYVKLNCNGCYGFHLVWLNELSVFAQRPLRVWWYSGHRVSIHHDRPAKWKQTQPRKNNNQLGCLRCGTQRRCPLSENLIVVFFQNTVLKPIRQFTTREFYHQTHSVLSFYENIYCNGL